jgi:SAM-dependent methyltransferase
MGKPVIEVAPPEGYRLWSSDYDASINPVLALEGRVLSGMIPPLRGLSVIDVAAGTGRWMAIAMAEGAQAVGLDLSPHMLLVAGRKPSLAGRLAVGDMRALPVANNAADLAICSFALGYLASPTGAIAELARIARNVILSDLHPLALAAGWSRSFRSGSHVYSIRSYSHTLCAIDAAARDAGLRMRWSVEAPFGDAEKPLFVSAGKEDLFLAAQAVPAMFASCWSRAAVTP